MSFEQIVKNFDKVRFSTSEIDLPHPITALQVDQNDNFALSGDLQGNVNYYDIGSGSFSLVDSVSVSSSRISDISINPSGEIFASTSAEETHVSLYSINAKTNKLGADNGTLKASGKPISVSFMQDFLNGQNIVLVGTMRGIEMLDMYSGSVFRNIDIKDGATSMISWNGCMVAAGTTRGTVVLCDVRTKAAVAEFKSNTQKKAVFSVDAGARLVALSDLTGNISLFDISAKKSIVTKTMFDSEVRSMDFSPSGRFLVAADKEKCNLININEITLGPNPFKNRMALEGTIVTGVRWNPQSTCFYSRSMDRKLRSVVVDIEQ